MFNVVGQNGFVWIGTAFLRKQGANEA